MNLTEEEKEELFRSNPDLAKVNPMSAIAKLPPEKLWALQRELGVKPESEASLDSWLEDLLTFDGWMWKHDRPARTKDSWRTAISGKKGFPDYPAARGNRFILIETKSQNGRLSKEQQEWRDILEAIPGIEYYLVRPSDRERIMVILE